MIKGRQVAFEKAGDVERGAKMYVGSLVAL